MAKLVAGILMVTSKGSDKEGGGEDGSDDGKRGVDGDDDGGCD